MDPTRQAVAVRGQAGRRLRDSLLLDIFNHAPDAIAVIEGRDPFAERYSFLYVNQAFEALYVCSRTEAVGADVREFMSTRAFVRDVDFTHEQLRAGKPFSSTRLYLRCDAETLWLEVNFRPFVVPDEPMRWIFIARDITAKKILEDRVTQLGIAVDQGSDLVTINVLNEPANRWLFAYVNETFTRATGYLPNEIAGTPFQSLVPCGDSVEQYERLRAELFAGRSVSAEIRLRRKSGSIGIFVANAKPLPDPVTGKFSSMVMILRDVTRERRTEARLQFEAEHDPLTGLHNRRYFERMLKDALKTPSVLGHVLIFIDLDGFKAVNDVAGHGAGDRVLRTAAHACAQHVGNAGVLARWGGDEFVAMLFDCSLEHAEKIAGTICRSLKQSTSPCAVTASIGVVAILPCAEPTDVMQRADKACYAAKSAGGDRVMTLRNET